MAPVRRARVCKALSTSAATHATECTADKRTRRGYEQAGSANLGHGRSDKVALHERDIDTVGGHFGGERTRPVLEKGLAAAVGGEEGRGQQTGKGAHGEDEAATTLAHAGEDERGGV